MARKYQWTDQKYKAVVAGNHGSDIEGLRSFYYGFTANDGYDLRKVSEWTAYQKRKVREHFKRLELLQAQPKRAVRAKGDNLKKLQEAFHGGIPSKDMKVALIPDTEPKLTLPGSKKKPPKWKVLKEGVSIARETYERIFIPFNQKALVKNADNEIKRVADKIGIAKLYYVQVGEYQSLTGKSIGLITQQVKQWMLQYDGKRELPSSSGNRGDSPKTHHWKYWLNGLIGYVVPDYVDIKQLSKMIKKGRDANKLLVADRQRYMRRVSRKGRK